MRAGTAALIGAMVLAACDDARVTSARDGLAFESSSLVFPRTFVGYPTTRRLEVRNESRASQRVTVRVPAPFSGPAEVELAGGSSASVEFTFSPENKGSFAAAAVLSVADRTFEVGLAGEAAEPVPCASDACHVSTFDPVIGTCRTSVAEDGTVCSAPCLENARCVKGTCTGAPRSCDDGNLCTRDACDPASGCTHDAITCAPATGLCDAAICDPTTGCTTAPAPDGTRCGPDSCAGANVCRSGKCEVVAVPEGYPCGEETPCQSRGRCSAGACVQPAPKMLSPAWSLPPPADAAIVFTGTADGDGNVYWVERRVNDLTLVSITADGLERWRVPLEGMGNRFGQEGPGKLAIVGELVVSTLQFGAIEAHRRADGALAWRTEMSDPQMSDVGPFVALGPNLLVRDAAPPNPDPHTNLTVIDAATGLVLATDEVDDVLPVSSEADLAYLLVRANGATRLSARTSDGHEQWGLDTDFFPAAPSGRRLIGFDGLTPGILDLDAPAQPTDASQYLTDHPWHHPPLAGDGFASIVATACTNGCFPGLPGPLVELRLAMDGSESVTPLAPEGSHATSPLMLDDGRVLVGLFSDTTAELALAPTGANPVRCRLSDADPLEPATALVNHRWIVATPRGVRAYDVPGWKLASHGVVSAFGSLARDGRAH